MSPARVPLPGEQLNSVAPQVAGLADSIPLRAQLGRLQAWFWTVTHPEFEGFYSLDKLFAFQVHQTRGAWRQLAIVCLAALPTTLIVIGRELLPLEDPALGWKQNGAFYARETIRTWTMAIVANFQMREFIPKLGQPWCRLVLISFIQIAPYVLTLLLISAAWDAFPLPLSSTWPLVPGIPVGIAIRYVFVHGVLGRNPELRLPHERLERLTAFNFSIMIMYCAYGFAFRRVNVELQIVFSFALYAIKIWAKRRVWKLSHIYEHHDLSAESVAALHLLHALFSTACLRSARSHATFSIFLLVGIAQDAFSILSIDHISREVNKFSRSPASDLFGAARTAELLAKVETWSGSDQGLVASIPILSTRPTGSRYHRTASPTKRSAIHPRETIVVSSVSSGSPNIQHDGAVAQAIAHLLHCREVVLLRLFVDVFVPVLYMAYIGVVPLLPNNNHLYTATLDGLDGGRKLRQLGPQIAILLATKLLALVVICHLASARGHPSALHQLAFLVHAQLETMQPWFIMNVLQVIDFPLAHMGNDLTFQFKWLHQ